MPLYMEANRLVIFFCFCALHLDIIIGRLDYNLSLESEWKSLMVPQCSSSLFFIIMAFGSYNCVVWKELNEFKDISIFLL